MLILKMTIISCNIKQTNQWKFWKAARTVYKLAETQDPQEETGPEQPVSSTKYKHNLMIHVS